jgi:3-methyladenine DNA glycosylase AlkC
MDFKSQFDGYLVRDLAERFDALGCDFDSAAFLARVPDLAPLAMKERIRAISAALHASLPSDYPQAVALQRRAFGALPAQRKRAISGFPVWVALQFVEDYGLDHLDESMAAMHELTQRFSAEFAIRPFLQRHPEATMDVLRKWLTDPSRDVRRLVSEGTRPRLPWAPQLPDVIADPRPVLELLEALLDDPAEYVRRSVANNLNDISKDHPDLVVSWLEEQAHKREGGKSFDWIARHGCRSLIKAGHQGALALLGFSGAPQIRVRHFTVAPGEIALGSALQLAFEIESDGPVNQRLAIDYAIHFKKSRSTSRRVFKWTKRSLAPGENMRIGRAHAIVPVSVRTYYSGEHKIEMLVNGASVASASFYLNAAAAANSTVDRDHHAA